LNDNILAHNVSSVLLCAVGGGVVKGVTQLDDIVYVVCVSSSTIARFNTTTHQRLTDIRVKGMGDPWDIVACARTARLYVADNGADLMAECVWRVSPDGADIQRWLTTSPSDTFSPYTLSLTSSRLLVTSLGGKQLRQFDTAGGDELRRVRLPDYMMPMHAVESLTGTFIVAHRNRNTQLTQLHVSEVNTEGQVLRKFRGSLDWSIHIAIDSQGHILVAYTASRRILLLDAQLALRRVILKERYDKPLERLCYVEQSGQLLVGLFRGVAVYNVLRR